MLVSDEICLPSRIRLCGVHFDKRLLYQLADSHTATRHQELSGVQWGQIFGRYQCPDRAFAHLSLWCNSSYFQVENTRCSLAAKCLAASLPFDFAVF